VPHPFDVTKLKISLEKVRVQMQVDSARRAVRAGGQVIVAAMIERTPVRIEESVGSNSLPPGEVKASMRVRTKVGRDGNPYALVGPTGGGAARVAHLVEYGHRTVTGGESRLDARGILVGSGKAHKQDVPAYPFLRPGFEASSGLALEAVSESMAQDLKKAGK